MSKSSNYVEDFDIIEILKTLWSEKNIIILLTSIFALFSVVYALYLPNLYTSSALLKVTKNGSENSGGNLTELASRYGGLASMVGVSLPSSGIDDATYAVEIIKSRDFAKHLMTFPYIKQNLMATKSFNNSTKQIIYDEDIYNKELDVWVRKDVKSGSAEPTYLEVHSSALKDLMVKYDVDTGLIKISFEHLSPVFAQEFVSLVISEVNTITREIKLQETNTALDYLNQEYEKVNQQSLKLSINALISNQMNDKMIASIREDYLLSILDPPVVPELKSNPKRSLICIVITIFGGLFSIIIAFIKSYLSNRTFKLN